MWKIRKDKIRPEEPNNTMIEEMWRERIRNSASICVICPNCGGSSAATCHCAYQRWKPSVTSEMLKEYQERKLERQRSELEQETERLERLKRMVKESEKRVKTLKNI